MYEKQQVPILLLNFIKLIIVKAEIERYMYYLTNKCNARIVVQLCLF